MYYKNAEAILVSFSLTSAESFDNLQKWMKDVDQHATLSNALLCIIGTKSDCDNEKEITYKEGQKFAKAHDGIFFETSAKDGSNVQEMF